MIEFEKLLTKVFDRLEGLQISYLVGGSFATGVHGNVRQTNDLDILIDLKPDQVSEFVAEFSKDSMVSEEEILDAIESRRPYACFQVLLIDEFFKLDCFVLQTDSFSQSEMSRRVTIAISEGVVGWCATPEDIILRKLQWFVLGNKVSDRQWNDIVGVLEVQHGRLDETYLDDWATKLEVKDLLDEARTQVIVVD